MYMYLPPRPMGPGSVPTAGLIECRYDYGRYGYACYNRPLSDEEQDEYELRRLDDEEIRTGKRKAYAVNAFKATGDKKWTFSQIEEFHTDSLPRNEKSNTDNKMSMRYYTFDRLKLLKIIKECGN